MTTAEQTMHKVSGILAHPVFSAVRPDVVVEKGPRNTVRISGPQTALDGFTPVLRNCGIGILRTSRSTMLAATP